MHIVVDSHPSFDDIEHNIRRLGALGLEVHITEMDVRCTKCTAVSCWVTFSFLCRCLLTCAVPR